MPIPAQSALFVTLLDCANDGTFPAVLRTLAAVLAFTGINHVLILAFTHGSRRANFLAGPATNTSIRNFMRHVFLLPQSLVLVRS